MYARGPMMICVDDGSVSGRFIVHFYGRKRKKQKERERGSISTPKGSVVLLERSSVSLSLYRCLSFALGATQRVCSG